VWIASHPLVTEEIVRAQLVLIWTILGPKAKSRSDRECDIRIREDPNPLHVSQQRGRLSIEPKLVELTTPDVSVTPGL
jgi:hypothetical protein